MNPKGDNCLDLKNGVAEMLAMETMSALPIEDKAAMAMAGRWRAGSGSPSIIARGIERRRIFENNADRDNFLLRLADIIKETKTACYAWAQTKNFGSGC